MMGTVVRHQRIIIENFDDVSTYFGLVKCTMLPPRDLFHPVLPYRTQEKLMFPFAKPVPTFVMKTRAHILMPNELFKECGAVLN